MPTDEARPIGDPAQIISSAVASAGEDMGSGSLIMGGAGFAGSDLADGPLAAGHRGRARDLVTAEGAAREDAR